MFTQLSHCAKIWYAYIFVEVQRQFCQTQIHGENITLILRSKVKVIQRLGMYATHRTMVIHSHAKHIMTMSKNKKSCDRNTESYHKPYKFDFEVKDQRIRIMNVRNTSSRGDRPICQIWYANVKANKSNGSNTKTRQKPINLTLRSKVNVKSG